MSTRPQASSERVRNQMASQRTVDTEPEVALRRELHARGLRFRKNWKPEKDLRCTPDIAFTRARVLVFVDGCFWHSCPAHGGIPRANQEWWAAKLASNTMRDRRWDQELSQRGWLVVRVWEHEEADTAADRVVEFLNVAQRPSGTSKQ